MSGHSRRTGGAAGAAGLLLLVVIFVVVKAVGFVAENIVPIAIGLGVLVAAGVVALVIRAVLHSRRERVVEEAARAEQAFREQRELLRTQLHDAASAAVHWKGLEPAAIRDLVARRERLGLLGEAEMQALEALYRRAVALVVEDRTITEQEKVHLGVLENAFGLPEDRIRRARTEAFLEVFHAAVADGELSVEEDLGLERVRAGLDVPLDEVRVEAALADQLRRARLIHQETPSEVAVDVKLKRGERCFARAKVRELKRRKSGFQEEREGELHVTDRRVLFVTDTVTSIPLESVVDAAVEVGSSAVVIRSDRRKSPYYFGAAEPFVLLAHVDRVRHGDGAQEGA